MTPVIWFILISIKIFHYIVVYQGPFCKNITVSVSKPKYRTFCLYTKGLDWYALLFSEQLSGLVTSTAILSNHACFHAVNKCSNLQNIVLQCITSLYWYLIMISFLACPFIPLVSYLWVILLESIKFIYNLILASSTEFSAR